jgi:hypothetical protein
MLRGDSEEPAEIRICCWFIKERLSQADALPLG